MPCSEKWFENTRRRVPMLTLKKRGIGNRGVLRGRLTTYLRQPTVGNVMYQPGCQPIVFPGVQYSWNAAQNGRLMPATLVGARPVFRPCPISWVTDEMTARDHHQNAYQQYCQNYASDPVQLAQPVPVGVGRMRGQKLLPRRRSLGRKRGIGLPAGFTQGCGPQCDPALGPDPRRTGCASSTRPMAGMYYAFNRGGQPRRVPYPVLLRPHPVGSNAAHFNEPFAPCPNRQLPMWLVGAPCTNPPSAGIGRKRTRRRG